MPIIKNKSVSDFTTIPNKVINDSRLTWAARGILIYLLSKPVDWSVKTTDILKHSAQKKGNRMDSIREALKELMQFGYIKRRRLATGEMEYHVYNKPQQPKPPSKSLVGIIPNREKASLGLSLTGINGTYTKKDSSIDSSINSKTPTDGDISKQGNNKERDARTREDSLSHKNSSVATAEFPQLNPVDVWAYEIRNEFPRKGGEFADIDAIKKARTRLIQKGYHSFDADLKIELAVKAYRDYLTIDCLYSESPWNCTTFFEKGYFLDKAAWSKAMESNNRKPEPQQGNDELKQMGVDW